MNLVTECVYYDQARRHSFAFLKRSILYHTRGDGGLPQHDRANGMRASINPQRATIGLALDQWAVGNNPTSDDDQSDDEEDGGDPEEEDELEEDELEEFGDEEFGDNV